jgi:subtilisin family serine protease
LHRANFYDRLSAMLGAIRMVPLGLTGLASLMAITTGNSSVKIGLIDGPVAVNHPDLETSTITSVPGRVGTCATTTTEACRHATFVAGMLVAKRGSPAPAICPSSPLLVRPIFAEANAVQGNMPSASASDLAAAVGEVVNAGAHVINLSVAVRPSTSPEDVLSEALNSAARHGVLIVAATGNRGAIASSQITHHPCVIPVAACDSTGRLLPYSDLSASIGKRGLLAPGEAIVSLNSSGGHIQRSGTSVAAPFVTGAIALLWSEFPTANAAGIKAAITQHAPPARRSVVPPLLDVTLAQRILSRTEERSKYAGEGRIRFTVKRP